MPMEYLLRYVFTEREYMKIVKLVTKKQLPLKENHSPKTTEIRGFVRLFLGAYFTSFAINKASRNNNVKSSHISMSLVACASTYRVLYKLLTWVKQKIPRLPESSLPALAGGVAGYALACGLPAYVRVYLAIYLTTKVCEWCYNTADDANILGWKPRMLGTWVLFPIAFSQLFYKLIVAPDRCPTSFKRLMMILSNGSLGTRVRNDDVLHFIAEAAKQQFPEFRSSLIHEHSPTTDEIVFRAHPGNTSVVSAVLHPTTDSDLVYFADTFSANMVLFAKYLLPINLARAYLGRKSIRDTIIETLKTAIVYSMASASALVGINLSQHLIGRKLPANIRFRLIGFMSGLWAILNQKTGRAQFLYAFRLAALTLISKSISVKLGNLLLPLSMAGYFTILNTHPNSITQSLYLKIGNWIQSGTWTTPDNENVDDTNARQ